MHEVQVQERDEYRYENEPKIHTFDDYEQNTPPKPKPHNIITNEVSADNDIDKLNSMISKLKFNVSGL